MIGSYILPSNAVDLVPGGSVEVACTTLVQSLNINEISEVELTIFGWKCTSVQEWRMIDEVTIPMKKETSFYDIGFQVPSSGVVLYDFSGNGKMLQNVAVYPMLDDLGSGMGSVRFYLNYENQNAEVTLYSTITHFLKAASGMSWEMPKSVHQLRRVRGHLKVRFDTYCSGFEKQICRIRLPNT
jgi:hypothetical protein